MKMMTGLALAFAALFGSNAAMDAPMPHRGMNHGHPGKKRGNKARRKISAAQRRAKRKHQREQRRINRSA